MANNLSFRRIKLSYGSHEHQHVVVWEPAWFTSAKPHSSGYWLIYVHGGAWRDPLIQAASFEATVSRFCQSHDGATNGNPAVGTIDAPSSTDTLPIVGMASINYRLSPHPDFPTTEVEREVFDSRHRTAKHPDHLDDVCAALSLLEERYRISGSNSVNGKPFHQSLKSNGYVLLGHSCGATLVLQAIMRKLDGERHHEQNEDVVHQKAQIPMPAAVIGVAGIYHLRLLVKMCGQVSKEMDRIYSTICEVPFGRERDCWDKASPACYKGWNALVRYQTNGAASNDEHGRAVKNQRLVIVLAQSADDELVDETQVKAMQETFAQAGVACLRFDGLKGEHDQCWRNGQDLARLYIETLRMLLA